ncbi:hypothetical protein B0H15DRAFT_807572 [Mycena belliarum]|uniref:Uncharacterized protein n=1 Tax=Mycena belliarum TaxID=1033014 RepID=A0AAD6TL47_9AGAR|nr:hypothetical protein B0H15DRAFT_807572 [Mycena belliae]
MRPLKVAAQEFKLPLRKPDRLHKSAQTHTTPLQRPNAPGASPVSTRKVPSLWPLVLPRRRVLALKTVRFDGAAALERARGGAIPISAPPERQRARRTPPSSARRPAMKCAVAVCALVFTALFVGAAEARTRRGLARCRFSLGRIGAPCAKNASPAARERVPPRVPRHLVRGQLQPHLRLRFHHAALKITPQMVEPAPPPSEIPGNKPDRLRKTRAPPSRSASCHVSGDSRQFEGGVLVAASSRSCCAPTAGEQASCCSSGQDTAAAGVSSAPTSHLALHPAERGRSNSGVAVAFRTFQKFASHLQFLNWKHLPVPTMRRPRGPQRPETRVQRPTSAR